MANGILGRGLSSLIPNRNAKDYRESSNVIIDDTAEKVRQIPLSQIEANPWQPRQNFDYGDQEDLVNSIKKHGILQPLIVTQKTSASYQLIAGERRLRAAKILELTTVPCLVRIAEDLEKLELSLIENIQRTNLNPIEEAQAYFKLIEEFGLTQEAVAEKVGKNRATIANTLRLLELPEVIQQALRDRRITTGHAKAVLSAESESERIKIFEKIIKNDLTVRQSEGEVKKIKVKTHFRTAQKDLELKDKEDRLQQSLGTKVSITKRGATGQINIEFYSLEELNNLVNKIARQ